MARRSWRDLDKAPSAAGPQSPAPQSFRGDASGPGDLNKAAALAPDSRLGALMQEREALERRLRGLSGMPGQDDRDPAIAARFPVASFAERRQQEQDWAEHRAALQQQRDQVRGQVPAAASPGRFDSGLGPTALEGRIAAGLPGLSGPRSGIGARVANARRGFADRSARARSGLGKLRDGLAPVERVARPLRDIGRSVENARGQLRDLDRKLADEDISEAERAEIRKELKGDTLDKVGGKLAKANAVLDAPRNTVNKVESGWLRRERQITSPMDRVSSYASRRDQRLSPETGGSGDLFERMQRNRMRALEQRREQQQQEQRDQRRRERAQEAARERREEDRRGENE